MAGMVARRTLGSKLLWGRRLLHLNEVPLNAADAKHRISTKKIPSTFPNLSPKYTL